MNIRIPTKDNQEKKRKQKEQKGINRTNSTSKIRKITANKKKRIEKGTRADPLGSNPHSKGEFFSRSKTTRLDNTQATKQTKILRKEAKNKETTTPNIKWWRFNFDPHFLQHQCNPFYRRITSLKKNSE